MRYYTRRQLMMESATVKPYITDGLVMHLDGADATDTTWVDRVGSKVFTNDGSATHDGKGVSGSYSCPTSLGVYCQDGTIEVCGEIISSFAAAENNVYVVRDKENVRGINYIIKPRENPSYVTIDSRSGYGAPPRAYRSVGLGKFTHSINGTRHVFNGTLGELGTNTYVTTNAADSIIGHTKVRIYQVRIYNRHLTEAEMKWNQEQDRKRYGITF